MRGHRVRVLDNLTALVHGDCARPASLDGEIEFVQGDVRDRDAVSRALHGCQAVVHLAARGGDGGGQRMDEISQYASVNTRGTAVLLEAMIDRPVDKLIVASSMSIYGEGLYRGPDGRSLEVVERSRRRLALHDWEPRAAGKHRLTPLPTPEWKRPSLSSIDALGKYEQERMCLLFGAAYAIPTVALRLFNVYGPGQGVSGPGQGQHAGVGVLAAFAGRLLGDQPPTVYEDGRQRRDFVSVHDVVRAFTLALERSGADGQAVNVGSGTSANILQVARHLARVLQREELEPVITGRHRAGDVRHCFADITQARHTLGYEPSVALTDGIAELARWLQGQSRDARTTSTTLARRL